MKKISTIVFLIVLLGVLIMSQGSQHPVMGGSIAYAQEKSESGIDVAETSKTVLKLILTRQYEKVEAYYDATMMKDLPAAKMKVAMDNTYAQVGAFIGQGEVQLKKHEANGNIYDLTYIPVQFEKAELDFMLAFDCKGKIAGLSFRPKAPANNTSPSSSPK